MLDDVIVLPFSGDLDISRYPEVRAAFGLGPPGDRPILVDLRAVTNIDSTFLTELLLYARRVAAEGRRIGMVIATPHVLRIIAITNIAKTVQVFTDFDEACASLSDGPPPEH